MTHKLELELIKSSPFNLLNLSWLGCVILLAGLAIATFTWQSFLVVLDDQSIIERQLLTLKNSQQIPIESKITDLSAQVNPEQLHAMALTTQELEMPWNDLFYAFEQASMEDIALLGLQPESKKQQVIISGEAKNYPSLLAYIDRLTSQPILTEVYLQKHAVNETDTNKPVRFSIFAHWQLPINHLIK
jgi:Tfp pilus assembly protein PilN